METGDRLGMSEVVKALADGAGGDGRGNVNLGGVTFASPSQWQNLRDLSDLID